MTDKSEWVLVPLHPTAAMKSRGGRAIGNHDLAHEAYVQMLSARPTPPDDLVARAFQAGFEAANAGPGQYGVVNAYRSFLNGVVCGDDDENAQHLKAMALIQKEGER